MTRNRYAWQKLFAAVQALADEGSMRERLGTAYAPGLDNMRPEDIPPSIRDEFAALREALEGSRVGEPAPVSDEDARSLAQLIVSMYDRVARERDR